LVRSSVTVIAEHNGRREMGSGGGGAVLVWTISTMRWRKAYVDEAVKAALVNLEARPALAGEMSVVLGPGWPGILLHEAIGHGLEGDFNRKGLSAFSWPHWPTRGRQGRDSVGRRHLADRRGSLNVDDEGHASQRNVLIEDGILKGYIARHA
jgi:TldD protein